MIADRQITIIAAMARNRAIGVDGRIPWHLPGELAHFKATTMGKPIIMGRKTWESIGRPLPGRQNIVVSRDPGFTAPGCETAASLEQAVSLAVGQEVMVIGGGELYARALPMADRMVLTVVDCEPRADTWFPRWNPDDWRQAGVREVPADEKNPIAYRVVEWVRRSAASGSSQEPDTGGDPPV
jgi:dihydrofolate reductase